MVLNPRCDIWKYFDNIIEEGIAVCKLCKQRLKNERSYSLRKHINKLHNPKSDIWKYFDNVVDDGVAVCRICQKRVRNNRHFNFILHLKQHDINVDTDLHQNKSTEKRVNNLHRSAISKSIEHIKNCLCIQLDEKIVVGAVMGLMVEEGVAPQIFGSKNMQNLLNPVCDALCKQELIKFNIDNIQSEKVMNSVASYIRDEFSNDLHWRLLSLKIDMDLNATSKSFCVSVQCVNETQFETLVLGVIMAENEQTITGKQIMNVLNKFNIDCNQIVSASWDDTKSKFNQPVTSADYFKEVENFKKDNALSLGVLNVERYIGVIGQLTMLDILKNPKIKQLFLECRNIVKSINDNSIIFSKEFDKKNIKIPQMDSPWKWGSTFTMINDLKKSYHIVENLSCKEQHSLKVPFKINENLKNFLDAFCKALNFLQKSILKFYTQEMHYGDFYAQWLKCKLVTEKLLLANANQNNYLEMILTELNKSIVSRTNEFLNQDHFKACLYLDPRFQHTLNVPEKIFALEYLNDLWKRCKKYNIELVDPVTAEQPTTSIQLNNDNDDDDDDAILNEYLRKGVQETESTGIYKKLEDLKLPFLRAHTNILEFWKEKKISEPEIYILATICFAIPATQVYEKVRYTHLKSFDGTTKLASHLRDDITLIRLNEQFVNKAIETLSLYRYNNEDFSDIEISDENTDSQNSVTDFSLNLTQNTNLSSSVADVDEIAIKIEIDDDVIVT